MTSTTSASVWQLTVVMVRETFHHDTRQTARNLAKFLRIGTLSRSQVCPLPLVYIICLPLMKEGSINRKPGWKFTAILYRWQTKSCWSDWGEVFCNGSDLHVLQRLPKPDVFVDPKPYATSKLNSGPGCSQSARTVERERARSWNQWNLGTFLTCRARPRSSMCACLIDSHKSLKYAGKKRELISKQMWRKGKKKTFVF